MECELPRWDVMLDYGVVEQSLEQGSIFSVDDTPANDPAAENINDDVEIEIGPFRWALEFGDIPRPDFIRPHRQQFRFGVNWVAQLAATGANFTVGTQDAIHGADRAMVAALVKKGGVDLSRSQVGEPGRAE
jgi:hypothetical protein